MQQSSVISHASPTCRICLYVSLSCVRRALLPTQADVLDSAAALGTDQGSAFAGFAQGLIGSLGSQQGVLGNLLGMNAQQPAAGQKQQ